MSKELITPEMEQSITNACNAHYNQGLDHAIAIIKHAIKICPEVTGPMAVVIKNLRELKHPESQPINTNTNDSKVQ